MKRIAYLLVLVMVALMAAACGGGGSDEPAAPPQERITVKAEDSFKYDPASITVPAGANVTITLENVGALEHSWLLTTKDIAPADVTEEDVISGGFTGNIAGGETGRVTFTAPEPGEYQFVCQIPGHAVGGMVGTFTVEASQ